MVKVVGKSDKYAYKAICKNCSSELEYVKKDVKSVNYTDYGGGSDVQHSITCPACSDTVIVYLNK